MESKFISDLPQSKAAIRVPPLGSAVRAHIFNIFPRNGSIEQTDVPTGAANVAWSLLASLRIGLEIGFLPKGVASRGMRRKMR